MKLDGDFAELRQQLHRATKAREEAKRDRNYDPVRRWKDLQEAIAWAEANMPAHLRRNQPRVHKSRV